MDSIPARARPGLRSIPTRSAAGLRGVRVARGLCSGGGGEGFGHPSSEADVDAKVKAGADLFRKLGATVEEISIPMHLVGPAIWLPIAAEGATEFMMKGNGMGT